MRHIIMLSGGLDSTAMILWLQKNAPRDDYEYVFVDKQAELPYTYEYIRYLEKITGKITRIKTPGYEGYLRAHKFFFPSFRFRWCTERLLIRPFQKWAGKEARTVYIGFSAEETRRVKTPRRAEEIRRYPLIEQGITREQCKDLLQKNNIHTNTAYYFQAHTGCWCCPFQSKQTWVNICRQYPVYWRKIQEWEEQAKKYHPNSHPRSGSFFSMTTNLTEIRKALKPIYGVSQVTNL